MVKVQDLEIRFLGEPPAHLSQLSWSGDSASRIRPASLASERFRADRELFLLTLLDS